MRKCILLLLTFCSVTGYSQFNIHYDFTRPVGEQGEHIASAHGLSFGIEQRLQKSPFLVGAEISFNLYGLKTIQQDLPFHNGYVTTADVHYTTSFNTYGLTLKLQPESKKNFKPFGSIKAGLLHYHSNMTIDDPADPLGCRPLDKKVIAKDFTWTASAGTGASIKWQAFNSSSASDMMIDLGVYYTVGGNAEYLKMSRSTDPVDPKGKIYYVKFEHVATGEVHDHPVGKVYTSPATMLSFRLGVRFPLD
ncbi:MAG TPA: hypothetical protein VJT83_07600 [Chitinophagaceae bacterium]|nr:hypothetical protein [Chitinophagaceae bacterium]